MDGLLNSLNTLEFLHDHQLPVDVSILYYPVEGKKKILFPDGSWLTSSTEGCG
jgi:hypothetical protein